MLLEFLHHPLDRQWAGTCNLCGRTVMTTMREAFPGPDAGPKRCARHKPLSCPYRAPMDKETSE